VGFIRRYLAQSAELVRIYATGGTGTLFEVINGAAGLPNVQVACYLQEPLNSFLGSFGEEKSLLFRSLSNLVFAPTAGLDIIKWGNNYGLNACLIGLCAVSFRDSHALAEKTGFPPLAAYRAAEIYNIFLGKTIQYYRVELDGQKLNGEYLNITIANGPYYGYKASPAPDARFNDGLLHLYLIKKIPVTMASGVIADFEAGYYEKWPEYISHYSGKHLVVSSPVVMTAGFDGEIFYNDRFQYDIIPRGIDFVCPQGIDLSRSVFEKAGKAAEARNKQDAGG
jgi:diacylglycerol kinase family enzyme